MQIEERELQAEAERLEREMELEKVREAERQKKLDEAAAKQQARLREIEEKEVRLHLVTVAISHEMVLQQKIRFAYPTVISAVACSTNCSVHNLCISLPLHHLLDVPPSFT